MQKHGLALDSGEFVPADELNQERPIMTHVQKPAENEHVAGDVSKNGVGSNMSTQPVAQQGAAYAALPEPLEIDWPELHSQALGCGVEDRGLHNRYECAEYGWQDGVDKCAERVPGQIFDADQMRAFADATHTLRAESLAAAYREELDKRCPAAWDTSVKCNCGAQAADEIALIEKTLKSVGITSLLNHGAASCVFTEGCCGVSQEHILAYTRKIALHCAVALGSPPEGMAGWISVMERLPEWAARDDTPCFINGKEVPPTLTSETVLVALKGGGVRTDKLTAIEGKSDGWWHTYGERVVAWQKTPASPTIEGEIK